MYMGEKSLTGLWFFLNGVEMTRMRHRIEAPPEIPRNFADWVGYRLHLSSNYSGFWHTAILSRIRDEHLAFDRFYELRDEFFRRQAKVVATIRKDCREYQVGHMSADGQVANRIELLPESLSIVVYTEDPGFFLGADERESFFYNGWFFTGLDACWHPPLIHRFEIHDESAWSRLLAENKKYKRNLARVRARIQRREQEARNSGKEPAVES
jgi:hypothetical protein